MDTRRQGQPRVPPGGGVLFGQTMSGLLTGGEIQVLDDEPMDPLQQFADAGYITDVVNRVKSGKEATVYCCRAHPSTGRELVAAKVYAIGIGAHYRMSKLYADGRLRMYKPDSRQERAIKSGKKHGREMVFADWVGQEYANLRVLHRAGADVPEPIHQCGSAILMDYIGDASCPAPMLVGAALSSDGGATPLRSGDAQHPHLPREGPRPR